MFLIELFICNVLLKRVFFFCILPAAYVPYLSTVTDWPGELAGAAVARVDIVGESLAVSDGQQLQPPAHLTAPAADACKHNNLIHYLIYLISGARVHLSTSNIHVIK